MRRTIRRVLLSLLVTLGIALGVLMYTEAGLQWTFRLAQSQIAGDLAVEGLSGRLSGPITAVGLRYSDDTTDVNAERVYLDWHPSWLLSGTLYVAALESTNMTVQLTPTPPGSGQRDRSDGAFRLPLRVELERLDARDTTIIVGDAKPVVVEVLTFGLRAAGETAELVDLHLDMTQPRVRVDAEGQLPLGADGALDVTARIQGEFEGRPISGVLEAAGTLAAIEATGTLTQPITARVVAHADLEQELPQWRASATVEPFALTTLLPGSRDVRFSATGIEARGRGADGSAQARTTLHDGEFGEWQVATDGRSEAGRFELRRFLIKDADGPARIAGRAGQDADEPSAWFLEVNWDQLNWPPRGEPQAASPRGSASLRGTPDDYRYTVTGDVLPLDLPLLSLRLAGQGDRQGTRIETLDADWLAGAWQGAGEVAWSPRLHWHFGIDARAIELTGLRSDIDGVLDGRIKVSGSFDEDLVLDARLEGLDGQILGNPVQGALHATMAEGVIEVRDLALTSGEAELRGHALLGPSWDIDWHLQAPRLAAFEPRISGAVQTRGSVSGPPDALRVDIELDAGDLSWDGHRVGTLDITGALDFGDEGRWQGTITAGETRVGGVELGEISIETTGNTARHAIDLHVAHDEHDLVQRLTGSLEGNRWVARLQDGRVTQTDIGMWTQQSPTRLSVAEDGVRLEAYCLDSAGSSICVQGDRDADTAAGVLSWEGIRLERLAPMLPIDDIDFAGATTGRVTVAHSEGSLHANAEVLATDGALRYALPQQADLHTLHFQRSTLQVVADDDGVRGDFSVALSDTEYLTATLALPGLDPVAPRITPDQALEGRLDVQIGELSALSLFVPDVHAGSGNAEVDLNLSGTVGNPRINGTAELGISTLDLVRLGTRLDDLRLSAQVQQNRITLDGGARMGDGQLEISGRGRIDDATDWNASLDITGEDVEVVRLPPAHIYASPHITLRINPQELVFDGTLRIPRAALEPVAPTTGVMVSDDVVIIGGTRDKERSPFRAHGQLEIVLGDDITVEGRGLEGRLAGRLLLLVSRDGDLTAQGEVRFVDGRYRAYGQDLVISQGRVLYAGGPVNDPAIDVVASRRRGERDEIEVGVRILGTAQSPVVELYSVPTMEDADVLSYLIIGRPIREVGEGEGQDLYQAAGSVAIAGGELLAEKIGERFGLVEISIEAGEEANDTAIVLGRALSPRLYVRYVQGLMDDTNAIQFRYELSDKWTIETESGTRSGAGADILYTLEH